MIEQDSANGQKSQFKHTRVTSLQIANHVDQLSTLVSWPNFEQTDKTKLQVSFPNNLFGE